VLITRIAVAAAVETRPSSAPAGLRCTREPFGKTRDGTAIELFTLANVRGLEAKVMTWGATLTTVSSPDRHGKPAIITLHRDTFEDYLRGHPLFGSVVGRYANRIAGARFTLDGVERVLVANAGKNHIHGGGAGFHTQIWQASPLQDARSVGVKLTHSSPDGHAGFPGKLDVCVTYRVTDDNELVMDYTARTDKPTIINLTNHAYWNLAGAGSGDVLRHELWLNADRYLPADQAKIPTGEMRNVRGTVMDFTTPHTIGSRLKEVEYGDYDHCYVLNKKPGERMSPCARVVEPQSGRVMEVLTTQPGVQFFTAKMLTHHGFCLETQHYPDSPNRPAFPSTVLRPGETFHETTVHKFSVLP
jgi:aldose 1-epimerase